MKIVPEVQAKEMNGGRTNAEERLSGHVIYVYLYNKTENIVTFTTAVRVHHNTNVQGI